MRDPFYDISDESERMRTLQRMIRYLSFIGEGVEDEPNVNGVYDDRTRDAVIYYQRKNGLAEDGRVNYDTWRVIEEEYRLKNGDGESIYIKVIPDNYSHTTSFGERSHGVLLLQIILDALEGEYEHERVPLTGVFGRETEEAVMNFQRINGLHEDGIADRRTWQRLAEEYNFINFQNQ